MLQSHFEEKMVLFLKPNFDIKPTTYNNLLIKFIIDVASASEITLYIICLAQKFHDLSNKYKR